MFRRVREGIGRAVGRVVNFVRGRRGGGGPLALPPGGGKRGRTRSDAYPKL